jgi:uncharacterized protein
LSAARFALDLLSRLSRRLHAMLLWGVDHPVVVAALLIGVTVALASQIAHIRVDVTAEAAMMAHDPDRPYYDRFKRLFGGGSRTTVLVRADDVFTAPVLQAVQRLTAALERLDGVSRVQSLTNVRRLKGQDDQVDTGRLIPDAIPDGPAELRRLRAEALADRLIAGALVARDGRATVIAVETPALASDTAFNHRFSSEVEDLIRRESRPGLTVTQVGGPFTRDVVLTDIWRDQRLLIPVSALVLVVALFLAFRSVQSVVIPFVNEAVSVVWALGLMALFDIPVNALTLAIPSLLIAIGFSEDIHMLSRYHTLRGQGMERIAAIRTMIATTATPVLITTTTTVVGFASLTIADVAMLSAFGTAACLGFVADFVVTVFTVPLLLRVLPAPRRVGAAAAPGEGALARLGAGIAGFSVDHRRVVAAGTLAALLAGGIGWYHLRVDNDFVSFLRPGSPLRTRITDVTAAIGGAHEFSVMVETGRADGAKDPQLLQRIADLQTFLEGLGRVAKTSSVADLVRMAHRELHGGEPAFDTLPTSATEVAQYMLMLDGRDLDDYVDATAATTHVLVRHDYRSSWELATVLRRLETYLAAHFPAPARARSTGETILLTNVNDYIVANEIQSLGYAFALIGLLHALTFRSAGAGLLSLIPNIIPALLVFGFMGLIGVPLNVGTAPIASVALGIAVDDTVHVLEEYRRHARRYGEGRAAIVTAIRAQTRPIVYVSLILGAGFSVLALSNFLTLVQFGLFSALVMLVAMAAELIVTPAMLTLIPSPRQDR